MFELSAYRLKERQPPQGVYDLVDPQTGRLVCVIAPDPTEAEKGGPLRATTNFLLRFRPGRFLLMAVAILCTLVAVFVWLIRAILTPGRVTPARPRPRLIARRPDDVAAVFVLRKSSGMMYDSRRVYDAQGGLIAQFRSHFKTTVRAGFGVIDLRGSTDDGAVTDDRPWLGRVEPSGGSYRFSLVGDRDAGRITPHTSSPDLDPPDTLVREQVDHYDVKASPGLRGDPTAQTLLVAAALAVAWWPPAD